MKITFLGTNGWYDTRIANTVSALVETKDRYIVFDAGTGLYKLDAHIRDRRPIALFISHLHLDHIIGLHTLARFRFPQGIDLYVPKGTAGLLRAFVAAPYTKPLSRLDTPVRVREFDRKTVLPFEFSCRRLLHTTACYGFRLLLDGQIISYCTDTGVCYGLYALAKNADLCIVESSLRPGTLALNPFHLTPQMAAHAAAGARAKRLILTHFDASVYLSTKDRRAAETAAKRIFRETIAARDDLVYELCAPGSSQEPRPMTGKETT